MFDLGFTMEELMFPENFLFNIESNCLIDEIMPIDNYQEQIIFDEDDDWFTVKQLNSDISLNDQILPLTNVFSDNSYINQMKSTIEIDDALFLPSLSIKITHDKNYASSSDILPINSSDHQLIKSTNQNQLSNKYFMSKSTSSLSFGTQSSTSMTNSSTDDISLNSNDFNEISLLHNSTDSLQKFYPHHKHLHNTNEKLSNMNSRRRRRKRTIFTENDIEHLKEAFIQNPKPNQQDIAILSDQLGHDSYVIRVWFYNKRQATKKLN